MSLLQQPKIEIQTNLSRWIQLKLESLKARPDTIAYVVSVLSDKQLTEFVVSNSVVLAYIKAIDFEQRRRLADGVLAAEIAFVGWHAQSDLCVDLARRCYASCWNILRPNWPLYEELADRLPEIIQGGRQAILL
jgi:hypothetical protein